MSERAVKWRGETWRVREVVQGVGGVSIAQLENLDRDAFAGVAEDKLEPVSLTDAEVAARRSAREAAMRVPRLRTKLSLAERQVARAKAALAELVAAGASAEAVASKRARVAAYEADVVGIREEIAR